MKVAGVKDRCLTGATSKGDASILTSFSDDTKTSKVVSRQPLIAIDSNDQKSVASFGSRCSH